MRFIATVIALASSACGDNTAVTPIVDAVPTCAPTSAFCGTYDAPLISGRAFEACACARGDAVLVAVVCDSTSTPTNVSITAPGWDFTPLSPVTGSAGTARWIASFGAVAPSVVGSLKVTWEGANCTSNWLVADEIPKADPAGDTTTFDAHAEAVGGSVGAVTIATGNANNAIWVAGVSSNALFFEDGSGPPVYSLGQACDLGDDWITTGVKTTTDPSKTLKTINILNSGGAFAVTAVAIHSDSSSLRSDQDRLTSPAR